MFPQLDIKFYPITDRASLPRRTRNATLKHEDPVTIHRYTQACVRRSHRLLSSFDELEREVQSNAVRVLPQSQWDGLRDKKQADEELTLSRERAWQALSQKFGISEDDIKWELDRVPDSQYGDIARFHNRIAQSYAREKGLTWKFMRALFNRSYFDNWRWYKGKCRDRHRWGEYLRSDLDWDWDTAGCLKRLFDVERLKPLPVVGGPYSSSLQATIIESDGFSRRRLDVFDVVPQSMAPEVVYYRYVTKTGEMKVKTFTTIPSSDDLASSSGDSHSSTNAD